MVFYSEKFEKTNNCKGRWFLFYLHTFTGLRMSFSHLFVVWQTVGFLVYPAWELQVVPGDDGGYINSIGAVFLQN